MDDDIHQQGILASLGMKWIKKTGRVIGFILGFILSSYLPDTPSRLSPYRAKGLHRQNETNTEDRYTLSKLQTLEVLLFVSSSVTPAYSSWRYIVRSVGMVDTLLIDTYLEYNG